MFTCSPPTGAGARPPEAAILAIGDEVLRGEVTNTNAAWLARELSLLGLRVTSHRTVADREDEIIAAFGEALGSAELVIVTGGLGPTGDDLTAGAAARFAGRKLVEIPAVVENIARRFGCRVEELSPSRRRQALVPDLAEVLLNPVGTAPGICLQHSGRQLVLLPGVPHEMRAIFAESVKPLIERIFPDRPRRAARFWHLANWPEADADTAAREALGGLCSPGKLELGTVLGRGWVTLRATGQGPEAERLLAAAGERLAARFADALWSTDQDDSLEAAAAREFLGRKLTLALAESCTGGLVASRLVSVPGVSGALLEALVTYSNESKTRLLGVSAELLARHGAVSRECAEAMALALRARCGADITLAVTGLAGPEGGRPEKPVGTVHFALAGPGGIVGEEKRFGGSREWVRERAAAHGLWLLWRAAKGAVIGDR